MGNILAPENCLDCAFHKILHDPDPDDWFCDDDMKIHCTKEEKDVMVSIRPYNLRKEGSSPKWCPLKNNQEKTETK